MKVVIDMNLSPGWAVALKRQGIDALHWSEVGQSSAPDDAISAWASENNAIVLTRDLDFGTLIAGGNWSKPSVVQLRLDRAPDEIWAVPVAQSIMVHRSDLEAGAVVTIDKTKVRVRALPLTN